MYVAPDQRPVVARVRLHSGRSACLLRAPHAVLLHIVACFRTLDLSLVSPPPFLLRQNRGLKLLWSTRRVYEEFWNLLLDAKRSALHTLQCEKGYISKVNHEGRCTLVRREILNIMFLESVIPRAQSGILPVYVPMLRTKFFYTSCVMLEDRLICHRTFNQFLLA